MHQTRTDHHRQHRLGTTIPGQQFTIDAYSHTRASYRRKLFCDLLTDTANGRIYPIFTKDRSSKELISQLSIFLALHPSWQNRHEHTDRFFRLDPENNYRSDAFLQTASAYGYRIEATAPRDKHANGIAERSVGVIAVKTNIAMLNPDPSVPAKYWCLAMTVVLVALEAGTEDGGRKGKAGRRGLLVLQLLSDDYTIVYEDTKLM